MSEFHYLPKRLRARQAKLYKDLSMPLLRKAINYTDVMNDLVSVQPIHDSPGIRASIEFLMKHDVVISIERE
jgi:hypothetical protein